CREIRAATVRVTSTPQARETAAVQRARLSRITSRRRIVVNNRLLKATKLQICKAAAIQYALLIGRAPQSLLAICKRVLKKGPIPRDPSIGCSRLSRCSAVKKGGRAVRVEHNRADHSSQSHD